MRGEEFCKEKGMPLPFGVSKSSRINSIFGCEIANKLPHGSGINYDWILDEKKDKIYAGNSYDTMDEGGMYGPAVGFTVVIPKKNPKDFKLHFRKGDHYLAEKHMLREYLEDIISTELDEYSDRWIWDKEEK